jgi:Tol biopolymer transport system component
MTLAAGVRLGPYEILAPLGAGGMGEVYRARDERLHREVAIKVLPERVSQDPDALARFEREAKAVAALSHPNILALHDAGRADGVAYAVMELLEGETLRAALADGPLSPRKAVEYGMQIALGLAAAHEKGIVHRDLKPDNVFVTRDERVKILDFGLAKGAGGTTIGSETESPTVSGYTEPGKVMGTVGYMSPEQVRGLAVDQRSDIFSFGSVLYEMLTARRAFQRETAAETMTAILKEEPDVDAEDLRVPAPLRPLLRHCLEKKPDRRFQSARDLAFALETASAPATPASGAAAIPVPATRPGLRLGRPLAVAALVAAAAAGGYLLRPHPGPEATSGWEDADFTLLTTDPGYEGEPTFSPDGRTIAYVADREGNFEIYLQQISGGPAINLTHSPAADIQPAFSPDGRDIAFVSDRSGASEIFHAAPGLPHVGGDIWVMSALGGPARRIVEQGNCPSWTPDGSEILYVHGTFRNTRIARVPATGGVGRDIPIEEKAVARYFFPRLSEDGRWLLYQNGTSVEVVAASGGKSRTLAQGQYPAWGRASKSVLFTNSAAAKSRNLWEAPFSLERGELSGPARPRTLGAAADLGAAISRDGSVVAYAATEENMNLEDVGFDAESGRTLGSARELTAGENRVAFLSPSPDGKAVAYSVGAVEGAGIWRVEFGSPPVPLTQDASWKDANPAWSPDGSRIVFFRLPAQAPGSGNLWIMNADGSNPHRVTDVDSLGQAAWMPDSKSLLLSRDRAVLRIDLASGRTTPVPGVDGRTLYLVDRQAEWVAFQTSDGGAMNISAVPIGGGVPRVVIAGKYEAFHPFFSPSGRWLYFQRNHKNLYRLPGPAQGWRNAAPEEVTNFQGLDLYIEDPKICADGSRLFYTRGKRTGGIVIVRLPRSGKRAS